MARGDITQTIRLEGDAEVLRRLEEIGRTGEKAFVGLGKAATGVGRAASGADPQLQRMGRSSASAGFAARNLSFQLNDVFTSLAAGARPMQVFAQQGGQIVQAFQQGGGLSNVLGAVASSVRSMITPMRLAGVGAVAAAAGFGVLLLRASNAEDAVRQFGVVLKGLGRGGLPEVLRGGGGMKLVTPQGLGLTATAEEIEKSARRLRDAGININDARQQLLEALRARIDPALAERIVRIGQDLNAVFGDQAAKQFVTAMGGGVETARKFAEQIGVVSKNTSAATDGLSSVPAIIEAIEKKFKGADAATLSPFGKGMRELDVAFTDFLNTLSGSDAVVNVLKNATGALGELHRLVKGDWSWAFLGEGQSIGQAIDKLVADLPTQLKGIESAFVDAMNAAREAVFRGLMDVGGWIADNIGKPLIDIWGAFTSAAAAAIGTVRGWITSLGEAISNAIGKFFGGGSSGGGSAITLPEVPNFSGSFARGGLVRGRGTGTSDSILARVSNNEYINTARAVRFWGADFFAALNRLQMPRFATGGLVSLARFGEAMSTPLTPRSRGRRTGGLAAVGIGGGSGAPVYLQIHGGKAVGPMIADREVVRALHREANRAKIFSAGRAPSAVG